MQRYEYRVVPAPRQGTKAKGVRSYEDRFAHALQTLMNELGAQGWDYVRADTLPAEERQGLTGRTTVYQNMLVFRRVVDVVTTQTPGIIVPAPVLIPAPPVHVPDTDTTIVPAPLPGPRVAAE